MLIYMKQYLTLLHSERAKLYIILPFLSAIGLNLFNFQLVCVTESDAECYL